MLLSHYLFTFTWVLPVYLWSASTKYIISDVGASSIFYLEEKDGENAQTWIYVKRSLEQKSAVRCKNRENARNGEKKRTNIRKWQSNTSERQNHDSDVNCASLTFKHFVNLSRSYSLILLVVSPFWNSSSSENIIKITFKWDHQNPKD